MKKDRPAEGEALTAKQHACIASLLAGSTAAAAAKALGVVPSTVCRWQKDPSFAKALRQGQDAALRDVTQRLKVHVGAAVDRLLEEMNAPASPPSTRVQAAREVLTVSLKYFDHVDLCDRLDEMKVDIAVLKGEMGGAPR